jgi:hypothetical protein
MVKALMIIIVVMPVFGLGMFLIIGSLKNIEYLVKYQDYGIFSWSYLLLSKLGPNAIKIFHILIGIGMLLLSMKFLLNIIK